MATFATSSHCPRATLVGSAPRDRRGPVAGQARRGGASPRGKSGAPAGALRADAGTGLVSAVTAWPLLARLRAAGGENKAPRLGWTTAMWSRKNPGESRQLFRGVGQGNLFPPCQVYPVTG
jgi:hypothetical protein